MIIVARENLQCAEPLSEGQDTATAEGHQTMKVEFIPILCTVVAVTTTAPASAQQSGTMNHSTMNHGQMMNQGNMQMQMQPNPGQSLSSYGNADA